MADRLIWLHSPDFSQQSANLAKRLMQSQGINPNFTFFESLGKRFRGLRVNKGKGSFNVDPEEGAKASAYLKTLINRLKPDAIVINDNTTLKLLAGHMACQTVRGSIYTLDGVPAIVMDTITRIHFDKVAQWIVAQDFKKLKRYLTNGLRREPTFNLTVCSTVDSVRDAATWCTKSILVSPDIETGKDHITSIGFTFVCTDGVLRTFNIPFVNPLAEDGCWWKTWEEEVEVWGIVKAILEHDVPKVFQNGAFDNAWLIIYRIAVRNYYYDTMHMWHSTFCEAKKALEIITSVCVDSYRYWKDEIKGETEKLADGSKAPKTRIPKTQKGFELYCRYNGLDCHYTALSALYLVRMLASKEFAWALRNYATEFALQMGPYFAMSMRGLRTNTERQGYYFRKWMDASAAALQDLRTMVDDNTFNPNSPLEVSSLLFDVLGAKMPKLRGKMIKKDKEGNIKKSVDEKILKFIRLQHPIFELIIDKIFAVKKPANNASKYGQMRLLNGRFMYSVSLTTETMRTASKGHALYYGTNAQNIPALIRGMFVADPGKILADPDYAQSDAYFVAFWSQDEKFIKNILSPEDTHCIHTEFFFKQPYDKVYKAYKAKDPWATDPIKGVRQNSKRIGHGANYQMSGGTLYVVMGHEAVVATALALGHKDCYSWSAHKFGEFCQGLVNAYLNQLYPRLPRWFKETCDQAIANHNRVTVYGGHTRLFFGNLAKDAAIQREISAQYGQGSTAGNINRTCLRAWNHGLDVAGNKPDYDLFNLHLQVHDNIVPQVKANQAGLDVLDKFLTIMEEPVTILGRTFQVPVECDVGLSWKDGMIPYKPGTKIEELWPKILQAEDKLNARFRDGVA